LIQEHPTIEPRKLARGTTVLRDGDPETSHRAAEALSTETLSAQKTAILELLAEQTRTDHRLTEAYFNLAEARGWPVTDRDSIRKRRAQLKDAGKVIPVATERGPRGRDVTVWGVPA
jgi:hypothetical protein